MEIEPTFRGYCNYARKLYGAILALNLSALYFVL
jgi:hypothetical protein